jgi:L-ascorbate metabolism protein UlaG (beta-lactamase superfamily)
MSEADRIRFLGHATVELDLAGTKLLTDPFLRKRVGPVARSTPAIDPATLAPDAVLISHLDRDHCDLPSLRGLSGAPHLVVPNGAEAFARKHGFDHVTELRVGESAGVGGLTITAVKAVHDGRRAPLGERAEAVGYAISGSRRVYFAGDTDLFDEMAELEGGLDLALLPISGWGRTLGEGHLDPGRAARALEMLRPRIAVPIHWGTLYPMGLRRFMSYQLVEAPREFAREAARRAPKVEVRILEPGESLRLGTDQAG